MTSPDLRTLSRAQLIRYFEQAFTPRGNWQVGMELEKIGRDVTTGDPLPYEGASPSVREVLETYRSLRGGAPVWEGDHLIGLDSGEWGTISLEPAGQVEWSSKPHRTLPALREDLEAHLHALDRVGHATGVRWLDVALEPELSVEDMPWMPKARYGIMRPYMGSRGRLAHRMMTQTASIQCAFDYADADDWSRKFRAAAVLAPVAVALFANSSRVDGADSGHRSYRQVIWRETDPDRCGLPAVVFEDGFGIDAWIDWLVDVPSIFLRRARGLVPAGGIPFRSLMTRAGCDALGVVDWELHLSGIFTEVRSYSYIEVRSSDLVPDPLAPAVPELWVGLLYHDEVLSQALELGSPVSTHDRWLQAMESAARSGLEGEFGDKRLRDVAREALRLSAHGLTNGAACTGDHPDPGAALRVLDSHHGLSAFPNPTG